MGRLFCLLLKFATLVTLLLLMMTLTLLLLLLTLLRVATGDEVSRDLRLYQLSPEWTAAYEFASASNISIQSSRVKSSLSGLPRFIRNSV